MTQRDRLLMRCSCNRTGGRETGRLVRAVALCCAAAVLAGLGAAARADSIEFFITAESEAYDYGEQTTLPEGFGDGEFTLELWIRPNDSFPVGTTLPQGSAAQRTNWSDTDNMPLSSSSWWFEGNFLLDGHNNSNFTAGTFSLQFYGGGRLRCYGG